MVYTILYCAALTRTKPDYTGVHLRFLACTTPHHFRLCHAVLN